MATDKPIISITVEPEILRMIEDYQYKHRMRNRSHAVGELLKESLHQHIVEEKEDMKQKLIKMIEQL